CSVWLLSGCFIGKEVYERRMADFTDDDGDGYHEEDGDCNDLDPAFSPGAVEVCDNRDENCDGIIDNDAVDAPVWYPDADGDGHGAFVGEVRSCEPPEGAWLREPSDCDDTDASVVSRVWYQDDDGDDYGVEEVVFSACDAPENTSAQAGDCDDQNPRVNPGVEEVCLDGVDNDCDGDNDECRWPETVDLSDYITISPMFEEDNLGTSGAVGDLDGDGSIELLIGIEYANVPEVGRAGSLAIFDTPLTEDRTGDEAEIFFTGREEGHHLGSSLALADLDNDGFADLIVGAGTSTWAGEERFTGEVHVLYGPVTSGGDLTARDDWSILGTIPAGRFGRRIKNIGDFDGDEIDDFAVGGERASSNGFNANGSAYVITAASTNTTRAAFASALSVVGTDDGHEIGWALCGIDLDGDGRNDFVTTANQASSGDGEVYLFEHDTTGALTSADADEIWLGEKDTFGGWRADNPGDLNGDGIDDLAVTALDGGGTLYILWGRAGIRGGPLADADVKIRGNTGGRTLSYALGVIGDINADGARDLAVGEGTGPPTDVVLFYGPFNESGVFTDTEAADVRFSGGLSESNYPLIFGTPDISGDGFPDFIVSDYLSDEVTDNGGYVYLVEGQGW
ncbi:MAG: MopE-related protein, partial [Myxococcota bacterium]